MEVELAGNSSESSELPSCGTIARAWEPVGADASIWEIDRIGGRGRLTWEAVSRSDLYERIRETYEMNIFQAITFFKI
jgi:hypothetical protein